MKVRKIERHVIENPSVNMSPDQLEAMLWAHYYALMRKARDRSPGSMVVTNHESGLPESANDLMPAYRSVFGVELALSDWLVPSEWVARQIETDEHPDNAGKTESQKEWMAAVNLPKEYWSDDLHRAVSENAFRLKVLIHKFAEQGYFITEPKFEDGVTATLGTDKLIHGEDGFTLGTKITYKGLEYAEAFVKAHPFLMRCRNIRDIMGRARFERHAPEWKKRDLANQAITIGGDE